MLRVNEQLEAVILEYDVALALLVECELVLEPRAAAAFDADAEAGNFNVGSLRVEILASFGRADLAEDDSLGLECDFRCTHRFTKYSGALPSLLMPTAAEVKERIETGIPGSKAEVASDDNVHFNARVVASEFAGLSLVEQHRLVYAIFGEGELGGSIHALALTTEPQ